jgi:dipeptidyl aminopeptidase/acylaminoacyl peptidase
MRQFKLQTLLLAFFLLLAAVGQSLADPLTAEQVAKTKLVSEVQVSPGGIWVAYTVIVPRIPFADEDGRAWVELHVLDTRDGSTRPYVAGHVRVSQPRWILGRREIAFLAKREGDETTSLYTIPLDGGEAHRVLTHDTNIRSYAFSGDASRVAFLADDKKPKRQEELKKNGIAPEIYEENLRFAHVYVAPFDPATQTAGEAKELPVEGDLSLLRYSPVDERLALAIAPTPLIDDHYMKRRIRIVDANTGEILQKIKNPGKIGTVEWSPDGKYLAMILASDLHDPEPGRLMLADASTGEFSDILPTLFETGQVNSIAWKSTHQILYLASKGVWTQLGEVDLDGKSRVLVDTGGPILHGVRASSDGKTVAFTGDSPAFPRELFLMDRGHKKPTRMTDSNPWLEGVDLAHQEVVHYAARDSQDIQAILIHPLHEQKGKRYPLVLYVHGGPESHHSNGWVTRYVNPGQVLAGRDMAVLMINYRGSTGYGVPFSKADHGDFAGAEFDDLVDGVDHFVQSGLVDKDRVGVTGGSYGGYATAWLCTRYTDHFAAGVMFAGISDNISKFGTSDIPEEMFLVHQRKRTFDDWDFFLERSPIYFAGQAKTPLLIMHGKDDPRVNVGQARELYRHIKTRTKTPVRLVLYPGEGHGNRKCAARYDYNLRMLRWLTTYLGKGAHSEPPTQVEYPLEPKGE